jgi:hypothetical protein
MITFLVLNKHQIIFKRAYIAQEKIEINTDLAQIILLEIEALKKLLYSSFNDCY